METKSASSLTMTSGRNYSVRPRSGKKRSRKPVSKFKLDAFLVRIFDIVISLTALFYLSPVLLIIAALIYLQDGGPVFFVQKRVGRNGLDFDCYKFRSMRSNADDLFRQYLENNPNEAANWLEYRKLDRDPRITAIGRFIRKTSLDEFPQLINVLKGEMSLVGPRPIMRDEVVKYGLSFRVYTSVLPGITGLWQVMGRNNLTYMKRVALDRLFARKTSAFFYLVILVLTIPAVLLQKGSR